MALQFILFYFIWFIISVYFNIFLVANIEQFSNVISVFVLDSFLGSLMFNGMDTIRLFILFFSGGAIFELGACTLLDLCLFLNFMVLTDGLNFLRPRMHFISGMIFESWATFTKFFISTGCEMHFGAATGWFGVMSMVIIPLLILFTGFKICCWVGAI